MVPEAVLPPVAISPNSRIGFLRPRERSLGVGESWAAGLALAGLVALRILYAFHYRVDSDEPQHLHVVWGWAHGLLQYRDVFDNHCPLFQMLCSPLMAILGEHAWIVIPMRLAMLPLYLADIGLVYLIGRAVYVQRWAVWMAIVGACVPVFFLVTTEFRTDDLWTTLWLLAVWLAVDGPVRGRRAFLFGLVMGAAFSVSMKSSLLLLSIGIAAFELMALHALSRRRIQLLEIVKAAALIAAGMIILPALLVCFFAAHGALRQMYYCVVQHNALPGLGKWGKPGDHLWLFPLSLPVLFGLGWLCMHSSAHRKIGAGRALLLMTCGAYYFLLRSYWPLVTMQDFSPILPLAVLSGLPFLLHLVSLLKLPARLAVPAVGLLLLAGEAAWLCRIQSPFENRMTPFTQSLAIVLRLTNPDDFVMDGKGETIFRNRPVYWVFESVTLRRIALGLIPDDVRQKMIQTGTCVAVNHRLRPQDQAWLRANYIEGGGKVWVAGKALGPARAAINFHTDIRAKYSIVSDGGKLEGSLDGAPLLPAQQLAAGDHHLELAAGKGNIALVWTQALDRGFSPFTKVMSDSPE